MHDLMSIGGFSRRTGLTVKALRLYDRIGILRPAAVELSSGYRYYSPQQVDDAIRIRLLRMAEMPLDDIRRLLGSSGPDEAIRLLECHCASIQERMAQYQAALETVQGLIDIYERQKQEDTVTKEYHCSFCGKDKSEVERLIAGPKAVYICNECVDLCNHIIAEARKSEESAAKA